MPKAKSIRSIIFMLVTISLFTFLIHWQFSFNYSNYPLNRYTLSSEHISYDLASPDKKFELPVELEEISGLSYYTDDYLACIQDEDGKLFFYDLKKEKITRKETFGKNGDYEGIEIVRDTAYILKSNGEIFYCKIKNSSIGELHSIKTTLNSKNDTEGLCFNLKSGELLIACKGSNSTDKFKTDDNVIYSVKLNEKKFNNTPYYTFSSASLKTMIVNSDLDKKNHLPFKPSALAIHPQTGNCYIISSVGKLITVLNTKGEIISVAPIKRSVLSQPEGICFNPDGVMYISSEGRNGAGYILQFNPN